MYCSKCVTQSAADALFCAKCGAALQATSTSLQASAPPAQATTHVTQTETREATTAQSFDEEAWRAAIGTKNTDYYLSRFREQHSSGRRSLWHWPAFFVTFYWLLYRKLWLPALAYFVLPYLIALLVGIVLGLLGATDSVVGGFAWLAYAGLIFVAPPLLANSLYYSKTKSFIDRQSKAAQSRERLLAVLEAKGGTSQVAAIVVGVFAVIVLIGNLAAVSLPAYNDYTKRAKSSEAIVAGMAVARSVGEYYERTGEIPASLDSFQAASQSSKYITEMRVNQSNGVIELQITFGSNAGGGIVYLIPSSTDSRVVSWTCKAEESMTRYVPQSCRGK
jgi:type II secretory pathway pseudopilin PulG